MLHMNKEKGTKKYRFFWREEARHFVSGTLRLIRFARKKNIDTIVVGGTSAQPVAYLFRYLWVQLFPNQKKPKFYALGLIPRAEKDEKKLAELIRKTFPSITNANRIMILEEFAASGGTAERIKRALQLIGKEHVFKTTLFSSKLASKKFDLVGARLKTLPKSYGVRRSAFIEEGISERFKLKSKGWAKDGVLSMKLLRRELREMGRIPKKHVQRLRRVM